VIFAGLSATSTWRSVRNLSEPDELSPQIVLNIADKRTRTFRAAARELNREGRRTPKD
jgi:hypothetical protein